MTEPMENTQMTKEQQQSVNDMLWHEARLHQALESLSFIEREFGKLHRAACALRIDVIPALEEKSNAAKDKVQETGAFNILQSWLEEELKKETTA